jgi:hypothetical protein
VADAITDAMITAGEKADRSFSLRETRKRVEAIFLAMQAARQPPSQVPAEDVDKLVLHAASLPNVSRLMSLLGPPSSYDLLSAVRSIVDALTALQVTEGEEVK